MTKHKTILRKNKSKRVSIDLSKPMITDQSSLLQTDINVIMKNYKKTGILPNLKEGFYGDYSDVPPLETLFDIVNDAKDAFLDLPSPIRKLMDNDPSQLESFIKDSSNQDLLEKYGLITKLDQSPKEIDEQPAVAPSETTLTE